VHFVGSYYIKKLNIRFARNAGNHLLCYNVHVAVDLSVYITVTTDDVCVCLIRQSESFILFQELVTRCQQRSSRERYLCLSRYSCVGCYR